MSEKTKILAYGSLRKDQYNFKRMLRLFGKEGIELLETITLPCFNLYDLGPFPGAKNEGHSEIVCDLLLVNEECKNYIELMEKSAGYHKQVLLLRNDFATIYVYGGPVEKSQLIPSGDWVLQQTQKLQEV